VPVNVLVVNIIFDAISMKDLLVDLELAIAKNKKIKISFANPEFVVVAQRSPFLMNYMNSTNFNLADGFGILLAARLYGQSLPERVTGTDFTERMAALSAKAGYRIYLLGGKPGVAEKAAQQLLIRHPGCRIVGTRDGYFNVQQDDEIIEAINAVHPDFLMVCLGNPRQEEWIGRNFDRLNAKVFFGNGGALDFASGTFARAPIWIQNIGFEWLWRLFQDFSLTRIKRQFRLIKFVALVLIDVFRKRFPK
jgi:N-acetylglucosaminyldiphosphoundecaprenol N-acetyl-beta-D-mannosaminyltransferase